MMSLGWLALLCASLLAPTTASDIDSLREEIASLGSALKEQSTQLGALTRQMILQQLFVEERIRSEGQSGIKQVRNGMDGTKSYYKNSHVDAHMVTIHNHDDHIRTVGMGEFIGVLNGVEFRTRHNDYQLSMPSTNTNEYHKTEDVPFPDVPPEVISKGTVKEQIEEMVEWFKAWKNEDHSVRDYRKYFRPVLCYLEGTWTSTSENIDEPFKSDRHFVDAKSWFDLQEKIRFTSYTGRKDSAENFAYLPTTIMDTLNDTTAIFAQWNYRILCHPLKEYLPVNRFRLVDELASRLRWERTPEEQQQSRAARFQVNPKDQDDWMDRKQRFGLLDKLMGEIPGMDNYPAKIVDDALGEEAYSMDPEKPNEKLNAGYYHRWYKVKNNGAMGIQTRIRGFSDPNLFVAMTNQPKVAGMKLNHCNADDNNDCKVYEQKLSYAIPLEIIYLTPLHKWNPYKIIYKGQPKSTLGKTVTANNRNGGKTQAKAYDGVHRRVYYITPYSFFKTGGETHNDPADTAQRSVGVLDSNKIVRTVSSSGVRIFLPDIPGVGILRQRYPIMPIHVEGSTAWKEIQAVGDFLMESKKHQHLFRQKLSASNDTGGTREKTYLVLQTGESSKKTGNHHHDVILSKEQVEKIKAGGNVTTTTTENNGHQHEITIKWRTFRSRFYTALCASTPEKTKPWERKCKDLHSAWMDVVTD